MSNQQKYLFLFLTLIMLACPESEDEEFNDSDVNQESQIRLINAFPGIIFNRPLDIQNADDETDRLYVVEQRGMIHVFENDPFVVDTSVFLDIRDRVFFDGRQRGMFGMAFHPNYENNRFFYVFYLAQNPNRTVISRFEVMEDNLNRADPNSELVLLEIIHPDLLDSNTFHGGGRILFGPDGFLYIALGDAGPGPNTASNGQNTSTLFGSILRIDVDNPERDLNYGIPSDNPFASSNTGERREIFAYGFRNPFRFSFDPFTGLLWLGDVGESRFEEVNIVENGGNYGWDVTEGPSCNNPPTLCDMNRIRQPIWAYGRDSGASVIGGFVYRGSEFPDLFGAFILGDFTSGRIWAIRSDGINLLGVRELRVFDTFSIVSFGVDMSDELLVCSLDGNIYRFFRSSGLSNLLKIEKALSIYSLYLKSWLIPILMDTC
jgi:glucose/arabinose dehydrogenase